MKKTYVITSAQNATPVHKKALKSLVMYCVTRGAQLMVVPIRYKNPTSVWAARQKSEDWWDKDVLPYMVSERTRLADGLVLAAEIKVQPTAVSPLSGFEALTGKDSCIIAHPKMQLKSIPGAHAVPKLMSTTGSVTVRNCTNSKAGKLGEFHHFQGGIVVETDGDWFTIRQLNCDRYSGVFIDLDTEYSPSGTRSAPPAEVLVMGDTHHAVLDPKSNASVFGVGGILDCVRALNVVVHDMFDGQTINPHHKGDPFVSMAKFHSQAGSVKGEIENTCQYLNRISLRSKTFVVPSNHNDFLRRWILTHDWKSDPLNAEFYLQTAQIMAKSARMGPGGVRYQDPFKSWVNRLSPEVTVLDWRDSLQFKGIECGMHGHLGPNGARGTIRNLARIGCKVVSGHTHTPGIEEGHYQTGTSTHLQLDYNLGPSSWMNAHVVIYANGKRAVLCVVDGRWRM